MSAIAAYSVVVFTHWSLFSTIALFKYKASNE